MSIRRSLGNGALLAAITLLFAACSDAPTTTQQPVDNTSNMVVLDHGQPAVSTSMHTDVAAGKGMAGIQDYAPLTGCVIGYDMSHNTGRQGLTLPTTNNSVIFGDFAARGATITTLLTFTPTDLAGLDVLWLEEDWYNDLSPTEQNDLADWVDGGGSVVIMGEDWAAASPHTPFDFGYDGGPGATGATDKITNHEITDGITVVNNLATVRGTTIPAMATSLVRNMSETSHLFVYRSFGAGKVFVITDEIFINSQLSVSNRRLGNQLMTWLCVREITIDIKPDDVTNTINCSSNGNGVIPIAILSTDDFDATTIDHSSVVFEGASETHLSGNPKSMTRHEEDVDGDGDIDLVIHVRRNATSLTCESTIGHLTALTDDGHMVHGSANVYMIP